MKIKSQINWLQQLKWMSLNLKRIMAVLVFAIALLFFIK